MSKARSGILFFAGLGLLFSLGALYNAYQKEKIKKSIKLVTATIYSVDNEVKYRHQRVSYFFLSAPGKQDSSYSFRDDISSDCFWHLEGRQVGLVLDSLNPKGYDYLLLTEEDFREFGVSDGDSNLKIFPVCE